jgi:mono/diheme cytochrome c family protein
MSASRCRKWAFGLLIIILCGVPFTPRSAFADPTLDIVIGSDSRHFSRDALLVRPDVASIEIANDVSYGKAMTYRAVPLAALLAGVKLPADSVIEAVALDGFAAQLPLDLITNTDSSKAVAWLAIEPADKPWPPLPGKTVSAGPFYIIWTGASAATVRSEQWPYQVAKLDSQPSPATRWPALGVDPALAATDPVRAGQSLFVTQCLPCHTLNGAGTGTVGPDLNRPKNPTQYLTPAGLHALIRDPKSVRSWPEQRMPGFAADQLSDHEIDLVIAYLAHMTTRRTSP